MCTNVLKFDSLSWGYLFVPLKPFLLLDSIKPDFSDFFYKYVEFMNAYYWPK